MTATAHTALRQRFWPEEQERPVWGIFDGARNAAVHSTLLNSYLEQACLYAGELAFEVERNAPHLVKLEPGDRTAQELIEQAWGNSWGIFAQSRESLFTLRTHFRRLLVVRDSGGRKLLFRFYDPRVFRAYLPTCNSEELKTVFGPVETFWMEARDPGELLQFQVSQGQLVRKALPLV